MPRRLLAFLLLAPVTAAGAVLAAASIAPQASAAAVIDGPDVSSYQHPNGVSINWSAVARAGHEFAIVKATEGTSYVNKYFAADYTGIRNAGMVRGSYHFARPSTPVASSAAAQARFYVAHLGSTKTTNTLPPALDLEVTGGLSRVSLITWAQDFLLDVRNLTGRTPMLYTYPYFWSSTLADPAAFSRYPLWMAAYSGGVDVGATLWQYTAGATVSGIKGKVDMSKVLADPATFRTMADGVTPTPWPAAAPGAPTSARLSAGVRSVSVSWLPPDAGSSPISSYLVTATRADGAGTAKTVTTSPGTMSARVTGLTPGVAYVVAVRAHNAVGYGKAIAKTLIAVAGTTATGTAPADVFYGDRTVMTASYKRDNGAPLVGVPVYAYGRHHGASTWTYYNTLTTDANGGVTEVFTPGTNWDVKLRYAGSNGQAAADVVRTVLVRQRVSIAMSSLTTTAGHPVVMWGTAGPVVPGQRVYSERYYGGHWHVLQTKSLPSNGAFSFTVTPTAAGTATYRVSTSATSSRIAGISDYRIVTVH